VRLAIDRRRRATVALYGATRRSSRRRRRRSPPRVARRHTARTGARRGRSDAPCLCDERVLEASKIDLDWRQRQLERSLGPKMQDGSRRLLRRGRMSPCRYLVSPAMRLIVVAIMSAPKT
jgi:hypothetical protein